MVSDLGGTSFFFLTGATGGSALLGAAGAETAGFGSAGAAALCLAVVLFPSRAGMQKPLGFLAAPGCTNLNAARDQRRRAPLKEGRQPYGPRPLHPEHGCRGSAGCSSLRPHPATTGPGIFSPASHTAWVGWAPGETGFVGTLLPTPRAEGHPQAPSLQSPAQLGTVFAVGKTEGTLQGHEGCFHPDDRESPLLGYGLLVTLQGK